MEWEVFGQSPSEMAMLTYKRSHNLLRFNSGAIRSYMGLPRWHLLCVTQCSLWFKVSTP